MGLKKKIIVGLAVLTIGITTLTACGTTTTTPSGGSSGTDNPPIVVVETDAEKLAKKVESTVASLKTGNFTVDEINAGKLLKADGHDHVYEQTRKGEKYYYADGSSWYVVEKNDGGEWERSVADTHPSFDVLDNATVEEFNDSRAKINNGSKTYYAYYDADKFVLTSVSDITNTYEIYDIGKTNVNIPEYVVPKTKDEKIEEFEAKLEKLKTPNFTVSETINKQNHTYLVAANGVKADNDYYTIEEGTGYRYYFDAEENAWYREEGTLGKNFNYTNITVTDLNENTNEFAVNVDGTSFTAYADGDALALYNTQGSWLYSDFGTTIVETPTSWQEKEDPTPIETNLIVDENGNYNMRTILSVWEEYVKGNNSYGVDLVTGMLSARMTYESTKLINISEDKLTFYIFANNRETPSTKQFKTFEITCPTLIADINEGRVRTSEALANGLYNIDAQNFNVTQIMNVDTTIEQNAISHRAENLLAKVGSDANVVFAYETAPEGSSLTYGPGYAYHTVAYTADSKLYVFSVSALSKEDVSNDTDKYGVVSYTVIDVDEQNLEFYQTLDLGLEK